MKDNQPDLYAKLYPNEQAESKELDQKMDEACISEQPTTEQPKVQKPKKFETQKITIKLAERGRKKCVTLISNLENFGIDLIC